MGKAGRLTKEEWDDLEPLLAEADKATHQRFMSSPEAKSLLGEEQDRSPGYVLLQRLKETNDQDSVRLFRAMEMYHHELTRADIAAAFLRGKEVGAKES
jgi:hypothetical protein